MRMVWGLVPRAISIDCIILVSSRYNTAHRVLASSMGEPAVEPLMSNEATIVTGTPERAVFGYVVSIR